MNNTLELAMDLISRPSVTPDDAGCQLLIAERLEQSGFSTTHLRFDDVDNLLVSHGEGSPCFLFLGHTDVVPSGPLEGWRSDPFKAEIRDGYLYGRGAADMKGSVSAMVTALEGFINLHPAHKGTIGLLLTSDEEGPSINGVRKVVEYFKEQSFSIDWCLVGEPSSKQNLGDVIKNGRRGSLGARLTINGVQGHVAYPHLAMNPIHQTAPLLTKLTSMKWDDGNENFPPTTLQVSNIHAGTGADNVIPGHVEILFNFRFSTEVTPEELQATVESLLEEHALDYKIDWKLSGQPFITTKGALLHAVVDTVEETLGITPMISTAGGTSDGRFIAPSGAQVVELGPVSATIHKVDECIKVDDLQSLSAIYHRILERLYC